MTQEPRYTTSLPVGLSVSAWIADDAGRYLLLRRSATCRQFAARWEPPGGKVEGGEDLVTALVREVKEETGLDVVVLDVAGVTRFDLPNVRVVALYMIARVMEGEMRLGCEHTESAWVRWEEMQKYELTPPLRDLVLRMLAPPCRSAGDSPASLPS